MGSTTEGHVACRMALDMALVLVVNDEMDMLQVYQAALEQMGHQVMPRIDLEPKPEVVLEARRP